jgi:hypothetical protein
MMVGCRKLLRNQNSSVFVSFEDDVVKVQEVPHHKGCSFSLSLSVICACFYIEIAIYFFSVFLFVRKRWKRRVRGGNRANIGVALDVLMKKRK